MKIHDISRGLLASPVYPGDPAPTVTPLSRVCLGDAFNVSALSGCLHNGTHLDLPRHIDPDGADPVSLPLSQVVGECTVIEHSGAVLGSHAEIWLSRIRDRRLLLKGDAWLTPSAAFVLSELQLLGVEGSSVAPPEVSASVHRQLLMENTVLLENLDLSAVGEGTYFLVAAPVKIEEADGAPVRALLFEKETF